MCEQGTGGLETTRQHNVFMNDQQHTNNYNYISLHVDIVCKSRELSKVSPNKVHILTSCPADDVTKTKMIIIRVNKLYLEMQLKNQLMLSAASLFVHLLHP